LTLRYVQCINQEKLSFDLETQRVNINSIGSKKDKKKISVLDVRLALSPEKILFFTLFEEVFKFIKGDS